MWGALHDKKPHAMFLLLVSELFVYDKFVEVIVSDQGDTAVPYFRKSSSSFQPVRDIKPKMIEESGNWAGREYVRQIETRLALEWRR
jgi:hypothetical protein